MTLEEIMEKYGKKPKPNPLTGLGEALTGFAAGWKDPGSLAKAQVKETDPMDIMAMVAMNKIINMDKQGQQPSEEEKQQITTLNTKTPFDFSLNVNDRPNKADVYDAIAEKEYKYITPDRLQQNLYDLMKEEQVKANVDLGKQAKGAEIQTGKEISSQKGKREEETQYNLRNLRGRSETVMDYFLNYVDRVNQVSGGTIKPGVGTGIAGLILDPLKVNEFAEAFAGSEPEYAAAVMRTAVPGMRALRGVTMFAKGKPSKWSTIESGVNNSTATQEMSLKGYFAANPEEVKDVNGKTVDYKDLDKWSAEVRRIVSDFSKAYKDLWFYKVYKRNPNLLEEKTRKYIERQILEESKKRKKR